MSCKYFDEIGLDIIFRCSEQISLNLIRISEDPVNSYIEMFSNFD